jgi:hypothetical protein
MKQTRGNHADNVETDIRFPITRIKTEYGQLERRILSQGFVDR